MQTETDNQQATLAELGWLAGIIDGEGWLGMSVTHQYRVTATENTGRKPFIIKLELRINNTDIEIIDKTVAILRKLGLNPYRRTSKPKEGRRLPMHECAIKSMASMEKILPIVIPYLVGVKHERALIIMRFIACRHESAGIVRPGYDERSGARGPRRIFPYSAEELVLIESCRKLQCVGASEITRENRDSAIKALARDHAQMHQEWCVSPI